jgi:mono/diheme cytochrome c family protein
MAAWVKAFALLLVLVAALSAAALLWIGWRGISTRAEPTAIEAAVAGTMRRLAVPRADRERANPVAATPEVVAEGLAHYADHCAACHGNDGSGDTEMGRGLYPKVPDMRKDSTQSMTDGELFYIIENGVRLTGMPGWSTGTAAGEEASWHLVHFIRRLPGLTEDDLDRIREMVPRSPREVREDLEAERFLRGEDPGPALLR